MEEPKTWAESQQMLHENANEQQVVSSVVRENAFNNLSNEERELLKTTDLKLEISEPTYLKNGDVQKEAVITGEIDGKKIILKNIFARSGSKLGFTDLDSAGNVIPELQINSLSPTHEDVITGEVDGVAISYEEAKELWTKYNRIAYINNNMDRVVDYVKTAKE